MGDEAGEASCEFLMKDYFSEKPWACKCGCGFASIDPHFEQMLNVARFHANTAFYMTSVCRCPSHNLKEGGKATSDHLTGEGGDIVAISSHKRYKILRGLRRAGFVRIGIGKTFIHAGSNKSNPQNVVWVY